MMKTRWRTKKLRLILLTAISLGLILGIYLYIVFVAPPRVEVARISTIGNGVSGVTDTTGIRRKNIYDLNLKELALSFLIASVYVKPLELQRDEGALNKLSELLGIEEGELRRKVASEKSFVWVARNVAENRAEKIRKLSLTGVYLTKEEVRLYPNGRQGGHVIGFAKGEQGLAGVETYYDNILMGSFESEAVNLQKAGIIDSKVLGDDGASLILSLDLRIQAYLEKKLAELLEKAEARSGMAVIMVPESGEILAMANTPGYDPNFFWRSADFQRRNRVVSELAPMGALSRVFRMVAELEGGNIPDYILNGEEVAKTIIEPRRYKRAVGAQGHRQANAYWQELPEGMYWSAPERDFAYHLSEEALADFSKRYGLSRAVPIDLPFSIPTSSTQSSEEFSLTDWRSKTTVLQLATAFSRILNGGKEVIPHLLKEVWFEQQGKRIPAIFAPGENSKVWDTRKDVVRLFNELTPNRIKKAIFIESLTPEEGEDEGGVEGVELSRDPGGEIAVESEGVLLAKIRYANVVLGAIPYHQPEIALVLVLDGAVIDQASPSVSQGVVENILTKALVWWKVAKTNDTPDSRLQEKELFAMWSRLHDGREQSGHTQKNYRSKMPKVTGVSLRKALQLLENYDLRIRVVGSGRVIVQHPAPGESFKEGADCFLELTVEQ